MNFQIWTKKSKTNAAAALKTLHDVAKPVSVLLSSNCCLKWENLFKSNTFLCRCLNVDVKMFRFHAVSPAVLWRLPVRYNSIWWIKRLFQTKPELVMIIGTLKRRAKKTLLSFTLFLSHLNEMCFTDYCFCVWWFWLDQYNSSFSLNKTDLTQ